MDTEKSTIVWVFGGSGAGKETFIRYTRENKPEALLEVLGWTEGEVAACEESMEWVAQWDDDPRGPKREELLEVIPTYVKEDGKMTILVKGQGLDLENNRLRRLKGLLPDCKHEILYIDTNVEEQWQRCKENKQWYDESYTFEIAKKWLIWQLKELAALREDFCILAVKGGKGEYYQLVTLPKELAI